MNKGLVASAVLAVLFSSGFLQPADAHAQGGAVMELKSPAFTRDVMIPAKYTCDGENVSPPLEWSGIPKGTRSIALIADDPDAPIGTWVHWVYYDLPPGANTLPEHVEPAEHPAIGGTQGTNDFRETGYGGPCPPSGTHRYFFKLYALDTELNLPPGTKKKALLKAMEGHIIGQAELVGKYIRK